MIGYVKIYKPELKMKDFQVYNAYYCGICKSLGKRYGLVYRNLLNYDAVFLSIAMDSVNEISADYENFRCILHPIKKKIRCINSNSINFIADITVFLTYKKLLDDINDENSLIAKIGAGAYKSAYKKSVLEIGCLKTIIEAQLEHLGVLEKAQSDSIDETADCYGKIYSSIFTEHVDCEHGVKDAVEWLGYNIGRWIYIIDAFEDIDGDLKKKRYNPILNRFPLKNGMALDEYKKSIRDRMAFILYSALNEATKAYDLIDKSVNSSIIKNILYEGLYSVTEKVLNGDCVDGTEKSI